MDDYCRSEQVDVEVEERLKQRLGCGKGGKGGLSADCQGDALVER